VRPGSRGRLVVAGGHHYRIVPGRRSASSDRTTVRRF
jgi:hypothetical protein